MIDRPSRRDRAKPAPLRILRLADRVLARLPVVRAMLPADMPPGPALISRRKISSRPGWARAERAETASVGSMVREYPNCVTPPGRLAAPTRRRRNGSWLCNDFVFPVARRLAEREDRLPTHAGRIAHPGLVGLGVATGRRGLVDGRLTGGFEAAGDFSQLNGGLRLDADVIDAGGATAGGDRQVHARIVEHPLGVVALHDARRRAEQGFVEAYRPVEIVDADMQMQAFHGEGFQWNGYNSNILEIMYCQPAHAAKPAGRLENPAIVAGTWHG